MTNLQTSLVFSPWRDKASGNAYSGDPTCLGLYRCLFASPSVRILHPTLSTRHCPAVRAISALQLRSTSFYKCTGPDKMPLHLCLAQATDTTRTHISNIGSGFNIYSVVYALLSSVTSPPVSAASARASPFSFLPAAAAASLLRHSILHLPWTSSLTAFCTCPGPPV